VCLDDGGKWYSSSNGRRQTSFSMMEIEQCDYSIDDVDGENISNDDSKAISCPLFMDGLPTDFSTNPALAAIASLMNDNSPITTNDDDDDEVPIPVPVVDASKKSSTKRVITKRHEKTKYNPYAKSNRTTTITSDECIQGTTSDAQQSNRSTSNSSRDVANKTSTTTIGEASLFLKMWKL
jgi:hypothetical protein